MLTEARFSHLYRNLIANYFILLRALSFPLHYWSRSLQHDEVELDLFVVSARLKSTTIVWRY